MNDQRFAALFQHASLGILVANEMGIIERVNNFLLSQFGYDSQDDLVGKEVETLIPSRYNGVHHKHRTNYNKKPESRPMGVGRDLFAIAQNGVEFPVEVSLSNYTIENKKYIIAFVIDITKRKEIEYAVLLQKTQLAANNLKIEQLNAELEQKVELRTQQLQAAMHLLENSRDELTKALNKEKELGDLKSRFVAMASHEFRTPLSTILSSASLLAKYTDTSEQEKRNKHIDRIKSSVHNLTDILDDFLSIGKMEDGKIVAHNTRFSIPLLLESICTEMQVLAKSNQQIVYTHTGLNFIELDESLLRNIIINLLSNAVKFTNENGRIELSSELTQSHFRVIVKDNGIGIAEDDQQHLFERFFRASNATNIQGTGLGLHIVEKYVELMNGNISFRSSMDTGTSFTITFNNPR